MSLSPEDRIRQLENQLQALMERQADFHQLLDHNGDVFWVYDVRSNQTHYFGAGYKHLYDLDSQGDDPFAFLTTVHPEDLPAVHQMLDQQARGRPTELEYRIVHRDGSIRWVHKRSAPIHDEHGALVRTVGVTSDITARKEAEETAGRSNRLLRTIIDLLPDSIYVKDLERRKTLTNRTDLRYMGLHDEKEALGKRDEEIFSPDVAARFRALDERVLENASPLLSQEEWFTLDGRDICLLTSKMPLRNEAGEVVGLVGIGRDITELKQAQLALEEMNHSLEARVEERTQALRISEQRLRQVIDLVPYMIYAKDIDGRYILVNKTAAAAQDKTPEQLIGKRDVDFSNNLDEAERFYTQDLQVITGGATLSIPEEIVHFSDGSKHILQTVKFPLAVVDDEKPAVLGVSIDITEMKQAEAALRQIEADLRRSHDELQAANEALREAARMKDEFMATISHELRTPLSSILGLADALQSADFGTLTDRQLHAVKVIESSGRDLLILINDLLELSRIEAGQIHLQIEVFDAVSLAKIAVDRSAAAAAKKRQTIQFETHTESILVESDQRRYLQILLNLLSNAIKFTPEAGQLGVALKKDAATATCRVTVWDHGIGIDEADIDRLFRPFMQLDSSIRRHYSGVGLGLALTKRLVDLLGGQINVESSPGKGSRFIVTLPCKV
ncbi:MAG: PAS domain-containing protein [Caldilinea sp.]|nr:PAS domain-containing protein [Caldilinea sp.]